VRENARCVDASQLAKALGGIEMARVSPPCAFRFCLYGFGGECRPRVSAPGGRHCYYNNVSDGIIANLVMVPLSPQREKTGFLLLISVVIKRPARAWEGEDTLGAVRGFL